MEIERINENTVKFYISYIDIEERGFDREEIWYNRERSEELFWEMMDEVHAEEEFMAEGPLWIQVQALDKGLEVLVTKAQLSKDGQRLELPLSEDKLKDLTLDENLEDILEEQFQGRGESPSSAGYENGVLEFVMSFSDFEDVISLSSSTGIDDIHSKLYVLDNKYYLYVEFIENEDEEDKIDDVLSILLEYGNESAITVHRLQEYGKTVIETDVFQTIRKHFSN
ncbi:adaptor protein MecA [Peribacillus sp. SCS-37]|uniref:adaptor protein MecA n=1 Tax=Paraperibacillus esterisolvens TaxID=3115296 RepID=UPI0039066B9F